MTLAAIYAHIDCADLEASRRWYTTLFAREPDAAPMDGLLEWLHGEQAGLQLFRAPERAGAGTLTLIVTDIHGERARLDEAALRPGAVEEGDHVVICRMRDPDDNLVVLAQPRDAGAVQPFEATDT